LHFAALFSKVSTTSNFIIAILRAALCEQHYVTNM